MIINQVGGGKKPTGTKPITTNGIHDVAGYANADVQVPTTAPEIYRVFRNDNGKLENSITTPFLPLPNTITDISDYGLYQAYQNTPSSVLSGVIDLSNLTTLSGNSACYGMFKNCSGITGINLSNLTTISGTLACSIMLEDCSAIQSVTFNSLTTITGSTCMGNMFRYCSLLSSLSFPALKSTSFGTRTNQLGGLVTGVTGCTIHFPSNLDPTGGSTTISSLSGYPNFGGINTVLAFDLPATE